MVNPLFDFDEIVPVKFYMIKFREPQNTDRILSDFHS